jgi:hypothetical protein
LQQPILEPTFEEKIRRDLSRDREAYLEWQPSTIADFSEEGILALLGRDTVEIAWRRTCHTNLFISVHLGSVLFVSGGSFTAALGPNVTQSMVDYTPLEDFLMLAETHESAGESLRILEPHPEIPPDLR